MLPTVVLPNAYATPRVGLFRMHVEIARELAASGFRTLRFDVAGVGDSPAPSESIPYPERCRRGLAAAIDFACGGDPRLGVVLVGHCDGAYHAYMTALADERVRALVVIDGFLEPNWRYRSRRALLRIARYVDPRVRAERWRRARTPDATLALAGAAAHDGPLPDGYRSLDLLANDADVLARRGVGVLWVFSEESLRQSHAGRLIRALARDGDERSASLVIRGARHVYPEAYARRALAAGIHAWLRRRFGGGAA